MEFQFRRRDTLEAFLDDLIDRFNHLSTKLERAIASISTNPTRRITVAVSLLPGETVVLTATADDTAGAVDPEAADTWSANDGGAIVSLAPSGNTCTVGYVSAGTAQITATATDPDGNIVSSAPFDVECLVSTDTTSVTITAGDVVPVTPPAANPILPLPVENPPVVDSTT